MMTQKIDLGSTWEEAIKSAYVAGYRRFEWGAEQLKERAQKVAERENESMAVSYLMNDARAEEMMKEGAEYKHFWWAIEDFYEKHRSEEAHERFQREAVVAEDLVSAYEAGCYDAILGNQLDRGEVTHLYANKVDG